MNASQPNRAWEATMSVFPARRGPGARGGRSFGEAVVLPRAADRVAARLEESVQLGRAAELRVDALEIDLSADDRPLQAPLPSALKRVLAGHECAGLLQDEGPAVAGGQERDVPGAGERLLLARVIALQA